MRWRWSEKQEKGDLSKRESLPQQNISAADLQCPLCGKHFRPGEALSCTGCALAARCGLVMCPNCSYEFAV